MNNFCVWSTPWTPSRASVSSLRSCPPSAPLLNSPPPPLVLRLLHPHLHLRTGQKRAPHVCPTNLIFSFFRFFAFSGAHNNADRRGWSGPEGLLLPILTRFSSVVRPSACGLRPAAPLVCQTIGLKGFVCLVIYFEVVVLVALVAHVVHVAHVLAVERLAGCLAQQLLA